MYIAYADEAYYADFYGGTKIPEEERKNALLKASRHTDILTFNRISGRGFANLSEFQKDSIQEFCCRQADFEVENSDFIESVLEEYAINGVSMKFGEKWNMRIINGVAVRPDLYRLLVGTGLCDRRIGGY